MTHDSDSHTTTDHGTTRRWVENRGGYPATIAGTSGSHEESGVLRIGFPGHGTGRDGLRHIDWNEFFDKFEQENLAFLHQNHTVDGDISRFCKIVERG